MQDAEDRPQPVVEDPQSAALPGGRHPLGGGGQIRHGQLLHIINNIGSKNINNIIINNIFNNIIK